MANQEAAMKARHLTSGDMKSILISKGQRAAVSQIVEKQALVELFMACMSFKEVKSLLASRRIDTSVCLEKEDYFQVLRSSIQ